MKKCIQIAIDGPSGAGKSTVARLIAQKLGILYVDTGALYRAVGLYALRAGASTGDETAVKALLPRVDVELQHRDGQQRVLLNGEDVSDEIRAHPVSAAASEVSALPAVRAFLLALQQKIAATHSVVMDGRDIGTVILPRADVKIFLTASPEARARRRYLELAAKDAAVTPEQVLADLMVRDHNDSTRAAAPLKQAEDAILVDTSRMDLEDSVETILSLIEDRLKDVL